MRTRDRGDIDLSLEAFVDKSLVRELVALLYQGILKRSADAVELEGHINSAVSLDYRFKTAVDLTRAFIEGPENQRASWLRGDKLLPHPADEKPVKHIASIGSHCAASYLLKSFALKRYSGPFDWIFSSLGMVADCIEDDFSDFLNREFYASLPREQRSGPGADHLLYRDRHGIRSIFNHADPTEPEAYDALVRCVDRFRRMLASDGRKVLFALTRGNNVPKQFERLRNLLDARFQGCELLVVWLLKPASEVEHGVKLLSRDGSHRLFEMLPTSECGSVRFSKSFDDLVVQRLLRAMPFHLAQNPG